MNKPPVVFLVDDQEYVLNALIRVLDSAGFSSLAYTSAEAFLESGNVDAPGCLILDLSMPGMDGFALQKELAIRASDLPLIFLSGHAEIRTGIQAMKAGACDFLTKPVDDESLFLAVSEAMEINQMARRARNERENVLARLTSLTTREREVMNLLTEGKLNKQVASALGIAEKTIKIHRARIMTKMQVRSVAALVRLVDRFIPAHS